MVLQRPIPGTGGCLSHATKEKRPRSVTTLSRLARRFFWERATLSQKKRTPLAGGFHSLCERAAPTHLAVSCAEAQARTCPALFSKRKGAPPVWFSCNP